MLKDEVAMTRVSAITLFMRPITFSDRGVQGESFKKYLSEDEILEKPDR